MLSALRIANFKAFGPSQRVPLRPITLLYGANSAGKSSVLHALVLARHAVETGELDTQRTRIGGEAIDLGGFGQYVHRRQRDQQVELTFELDPRRLSGRAAELLRGARDVVVELGIGSGAAPDKEQDGEVRVERFAVEIDGRPMLSMSVRRGGILRLDRLDHAHPVFRDVFHGILTVATTTQDVREEDFASLAGVLDDLVPSITARVAGLFPRIEEEPAGSDGEGVQDLLTVSRARRREDLANAGRLFLPRVLRDLVGGLSEALEGEVGRLAYLGPLRSYPPRHLAFSQQHDPNWFAGGGYAWDVVRTHQKVRDRVNGWLGDAERLKTPYEIRVRELIPDETLKSELNPLLAESFYEFALALVGEMERPEPSAEMDALRRAAIEDADADAAADVLINAVDSLVDIEESTEQLVQKVIAARSETLQDLVLVDKRSGTVVSHRDVGIGVSQVLPVLVAAYASNGRLLAIEQPEIHLHPGLQAELGDVVIESALGPSGNSFLVETHSEHLLLRIMRRMRETATGRSTSAFPVRPEDVMVLFVEPDGAHSLVREMPLNEHGELVKAWPGGFFEEGMREIF